jgi:hypothetical protein
MDREIGIHVFIQRDMQREIREKRETRRNYIDDDRIQKETHASQPARERESEKKYDDVERREENMC